MWGSPYLTKGPLDSRVLLRRTLSRSRFLGASAWGPRLAIVRASALLYWVTKGQTWTQSATKAKGDWVSQLGFHEELVSH